MRGFWKRKKTVAIFLSLFLLLAVLLPKPNRQEREAQAITIPFVSAPAFAEALSSILPDAYTFGLTGLALGTGVFLYYSGRQLYDWAAKNGYLPISSDLIKSYTPTDTASINSFLSQLLPGDVVSTKYTSFGAGASVWFYDCSSHHLKKVDIPSTSTFANVAYLDFVNGKEYIYGYNYICSDGTVSSCNQGEIQQIGKYPISEYCGGVSDKILRDISTGKFVPPPPAVVSTVPVPDAPLYSIPDSAVTYQQTDSIDWDKDGVNDTLILPAPYSTPSDVTGDVAVLTPSLQEIAASQAELAQAVKSQSQALQEIAASQSATAQAIEGLNSTVSTLPQRIAQEQQKEMEKQADNVEYPSLPAEFAFPTDLDLPKEVDLKSKFEHGVVLPTPKISASGVCSFSFTIPLYGSVHADFCPYEHVLRSAGDALLSFSSLFFLIWVFM